MGKRFANLQRGDTVIEVIFAVTIFSMVAVGAISIMNKGVALAQQSLEVTLVRQQIDSQAEMLRYLHDNSRTNADYAAVWRSLPTKDSSSIRQVVGSSTDNCGDVPSGFFLYDKSNSIKKGDASVYENPATYAKITTEGTNVKAQGISIQLTKGNKHYDAYIQACWYGPGNTIPTTMGTIVRLYDNDA